MIYTIQVSDFEQGGFYVNTGEYYSSDTEIRASAIAVPSHPIGDISINCGTNSWSFICYDANGSFRSVSESSGWKLSGATVDLSSYDWIRFIQIEINNLDGISPPYEAELKISIVWTMGENGYPVNDAPPCPEPIVRPFPDALWRIDYMYGGRHPYSKLMPTLNQVDIWVLERENIIIVYDKSEPQTGFKSNGLAVLQPSSCISLHNDDRWEITIKHPFDEWGKWKHLRVQNILKVDGQLFRIDKQNPHIDKSGGYMEAHARHITGDLADELIHYGEWGGGSGAQFINWAKNSIVPPLETETYELPYNFTGNSDISNIAADKYENVSLLGALVGLDNSLLVRSGGELYRDNFYFSINSRMEKAKDNAFYLRYDLDMVEISQEIDYSNFCTLIYCYDNWGNMWAVSWAGTITWAIHHQITRAVKFNYSTPNGGMDRLIADGWAFASKCFKPAVTYRIKIASLKNDPKYKEFVGLQNYNYGDSGTIYCPELDISTEQKIVEIEKDELTGEILSMTLGNMKSSVVRPGYMSSTISSGYSVSDKMSEALINSTIGTNILSLQSYPVDMLQRYSVEKLQGGI